MNIDVFKNLHDGEMKELEMAIGCFNDNSLPIKHKTANKCVSRHIVSMYNSEHLFFRLAMEFHPSQV